SVNQLFTGDPYKLGDLLKFKDAVKTYFDGLNGGFPTMSGLMDVVLGELNKKMSGSALQLSLTMENGRPELMMEIEFNLHPEFRFDADLGTSLSALGVQAASATVVVEANLKVDAAFGLDLTELIETGSLGNAAFFEMNDLSADLALSVTNLNVNVDL